MYGSNNFSLTLSHTKCNIGYGLLLCPNILNFWQVLVPPIKVFRRIIGFRYGKAADHNNGNDDEDRQIEFVYSFVVAAAAACAAAVFNILLFVHT